MNKPTKRTITLIRHAKSSWRDPSLADFERPLNKRGMRDAPRVGAALSEKAISFDKVLCSEARRAKQTLSGLMQALEIHEEIVEYRRDLYAASASDLFSCLKEQTDSNRHIALLGHNPGMEELANSLCDEAAGPMPTCCVIQLLFESTSWNKLLPASGELTVRLKPRNL